MFLVIIVCLPLWQPSPETAKALTIDIEDRDVPAVDAGTCTFTVSLKTGKSDTLPVQRVDLRIYNTASPDDYDVTLEELPLPDTEETTLFADYTEDGSVASVTATSGPGWGWGIDSRFAFGYSYEWRSWTYMILSMKYSPPSIGYGYVAGTGGGETGITYTVTWTAPADWPAGSYSVEAIVFGSMSARVDGDATLAFTNEIIPTFDIPEWRGGTTTPPPVSTPVPTSAASTTTAVTAPSSPAVTAAQPATTTTTIPDRTAPPSTSGWLVGGIIVAAIVGAALAWLIMARRRG